MSAVEPAEAWGALREPLATWWAPEAPDARHASTLRRSRFEYTSRGDRVAGRLVLPAQAKASKQRPAPLILVAHAARSSREGPELEMLGPTWAGRGAAVAAVDLPLHGARGSAKLTARWLATLDPAHVPSAEDTRLQRDLASQACEDFRRALQALAEHGEIGTARIGFAGLGLGALLGAAFCAGDARVAAVGLAGLPQVAGGTLDPLPHLEKLAPRPVLLVASRPHAGPASERPDAWRRAAGPGCRLRWIDEDPQGAPQQACEALAPFLAEALALP